MNLATVALLRWHARHPLLLALTVLGAALGAATVIAIDLANDSSRRAFDHAVAGLSGRATHQVVGGGDGIPEAWYVALRVEHGFRHCAPVVRGQVALPDGRRLDLLGIDPLAEAELRPDLARGGRLGDDQLMARPGALACSTGLAAAYGWQPGDQLTLSVGQVEHRLPLVAVIAARDELAAAALSDVLLCDLATAQELLDRVGWLDRVDLVLDDPALLPPLPPAAVLRPASAQRTQLADMTRAFHLNLSAMSLLALAVAAFLVFNALGFAVVQRRDLIGRLRAVGAEPAQLARALLLEAVLIGAAASLLGGLGGRILAELLLDQIATTLQDLYLAREVATVVVTPLSLAKAALVGLGAALVAAAVPTWEALRIPPRAVLIEPPAVPRAPLWGLVAALGLGLAAIGLLLADHRGVGSAFIATALAIAAGSALIPALLIVWCRLGAALAARLHRPLAVMVWSGPAAGLRRSAVAAAALILAVAAALGVTVMVASFRGSLERWLGDTLQADIYASAGSGLTSEDRALDPAFIATLRADPAVARLTLRRSTEVHGRSRSFRAIVVDPPAGRLPPLRAGDPVTAWAGFVDGAVIISEQLAWRLRLAPGDRLELRSHDGWRSFPVAAVSADFAGDQGSLYWHAATFARHFALPPPDGVAVDLIDPAQIDAVIERLGQAPGAAGLGIRSQRALREASLTVFDRTFRITEALRLLATGVAVIGIISAIAALAAERHRSTALLRARGATPRQVWALVVGECGVLGLFCGVVAVPAGLGLAAMLTLIINRRSFGWTLDLDPSPGQWPIAVLTAVVAALVAGIIPAARAARATPAEVLRAD